MKNSELETIFLKGDILNFRYATKWYYGVVHRDIFHNDYDVNIYVGMTQESAADNYLRKDKKFFKTKYMPDGYKVGRITDIKLDWSKRLI